MHIEYSATASSVSDLGVEFLQLSGNFGGASCRVRPSMLSTSVASTTHFISVSPARTCCALSRLQAYDDVHVSIATAGVTKFFAVSLRDAFGNSVNACGEKFMLNHVGGAAQSRFDCSKSTAEFHPVSSGMFTIDGTLHSSASCSLPLIKMIVRPFVRNFQQSSVKGVALTLATCGETSWMTVTIRDMFRNPQPKPESPLVRCSLNGSSAIQTNVSPCPGVLCPDSLEDTFGNRQYLKPDYIFSYVATQAGYFKLSVHTRDSGHIAGSPFYVQILPSSVCLSYSVSTGSSLTIVTNEQAVSFVISSRDSFGNFQPNGLWLSVVESSFVKQSVAASLTSGADFRATNQIICGVDRCSISSMLLQNGYFFAT